MNFQASWNSLAVTLRHVRQEEPAKRSWNVAQWAGSGKTQSHGKIVLRVA